MRIRIIDAFTDRPFAGNPAAVCLLDADTWPEEGWMQQVAAELHLSETAFAHPLPPGSDADADWALRWFTPEVESKLCGHATLATAHAMHRDRGTPGTVRFVSRSGVLVAHTAEDGTITLDFPAAPATQPGGASDAGGSVSSMSTSRRRKGTVRATSSCLYSSHACHSIHSAFGVSPARRLLQKSSRARSNTGAEVEGAPKTWATP